MIVCEEVEAQERSTDKKDPDICAHRNAHELGARPATE
jgi:hypothetical protein